VEQRVKSCRCKLHSDWRDFVSHSYIVPRASHPVVAGGACPGRVLAAERKVISMDHNRNCDFVSHPELIRHMCQ
jgi:hypothetical protein